MKYYVVSDTHGFYTELRKSLSAAGFFRDKEPHKLIVCGDMLDRGTEALKIENFMLNLLDKNELIYVRGNHEDLLVEMISNISKHLWNIANGSSHHVSNGTWQSALQLAQMKEYDALMHPQELVFKVENSEFYKKLIPSSIDYFETKNYIFVHGWIPCTSDSLPPYYQKGRKYKYNEDWRHATNKSWENARWHNGMLLGEVLNIREPGKTIVCGHWHASYGHYQLENKKGDEFSPKADHSPYYAKSLIAIDACTVVSRKVNCIVLEDDDLSPSLAIQSKS